MNNVRVCSLCGRMYVYDEFENNGYEDVCNHCKPIEKTEESENGKINRYGLPKGPRSEDISFIANRVYNRIKYQLSCNKYYKANTEDIIMEFRSMNDDYDDWWVRCLTTKEQEREFVYKLIEQIKKLGIEEIEDNSFN